MERRFRKEEDKNCQCQCHFPSNVICQINSCCHCLCNYDNAMQRTLANNSVNYSQNLNNSNYNNRNYYSSNSHLNTYSNEKPNNKNLMMTSSSTNYNSGNDSILNSGRKNYYAMRKMQNQGLQDSQLQRNFSDPNFNFNTINNQSQPNNNSSIIHQESYRNNNTVPNNSFYNNNANNPLPQKNQSNNINDNNNIIYSKQLTYNYKENLNASNPNDDNLNHSKSNINNINDNIPNNNMNRNMNMNNGINDPNNNNMHNPLDLSYLMHVNDIDQLKSDLVKAHDFISILQKENDYLKKQRDGALNQLAANENMKNIDRVKCDEIQNENKELRKRLNDEIKNNKIKDNYISDLKADLNNLQNIIKDKDRQIQNLLLDMRKLEQDANNEINKLKNIIDDLNREKEAIIRDFQKQINDLNDELRHLNNLLEDEKRKVKELENKIKTMKRFDEKRQKLLENLFNWYNNMNKLLNTNTATGKAPPKELLNDVINLQTPDEFKDKLNQIEEKLKQFIDDMKLKFGECFACDIACCTSEVDRLKYFRKYYPGPPKDYLEGKKKCKCV